MIIYHIIIRPYSIWRCTRHGTGRRERRDIEKKRIKNNKYMTNCVISLIVIVAITVVIFITIYHILKYIQGAGTKYVCFPVASYRCWSFTDLNTRPSVSNNVNVDCSVLVRELKTHQSSSVPLWSINIEFSYFSRLHAVPFSILWVLLHPPSDAVGVSL